MVVTRFPPVETADDDGLIAIGGDLDPQSVLLAYQSGIFPWPIDEHTLAWFAPPERAVIFLDEFHVSRKLKQVLKRNIFSLRHNTNFRGVIERCAELKNRGSQDGTWITPTIIDSYVELHRLGFCHSFEAYMQDQLVGGLYGIQIGRFFAAESSFFRVPNASKAAMCLLADYLRENGSDWFDCQVLTPFSESFGAREVARDGYMRLLANALADY